VAVNEKLAPVALVGSLGWAVIEVFGAAVSTVQVKDAGDASVLPAASVARTSKVCEASASPVYDFGRGAGVPAARVEVCTRRSTSRSR
jgi:hypothetical protein